MDFFEVENEIRTSFSGVFESIYFPKALKGTGLAKSDLP